MVKKAQIDENDNVVNFIEADENMNELNGYTLIEAISGASPGDIYDPTDGTFTTPRPPLDQRKSSMYRDVRKRFQDTLAAGFDDGNGLRWAATDDARSRVLDLTQRIQEFRAGNVSSPLPNGKSTMKLRDASNQPHDVDPNIIISLAEQGSDFKDSAEDRLEDLLVTIAAAVSHDDLDAIDVTNGWPVAPTS